MVIIRWLNPALLFCCLFLWLCGNEFSQNICEQLQRCLIQTKLFYKKKKKPFLCKNKGIYNFIYCLNAVSVAFSCFYIFPYFFFFNCFCILCAILAVQNLQFSQEMVYVVFSYNFHTFKKYLTCFMNIFSYVPSKRSKNLLLALFSSFMIFATVLTQIAFSCNIKLLVSLLLLLPVLLLLNYFRLVLVFNLSSSCLKVAFFRFLPCSTKRFLLQLLVNTLVTS